MLKSFRLILLFQLYAFSTDVTKLKCQPKALLESLGFTGVLETPVAFAVDEKATKEKQDKDEKEKERLEKDENLVRDFTGIDLRIQCQDYFIDHGICVNQQQILEVQKLYRQHVISDYSILQTDLDNALKAVNINAAPAAKETKRILATEAAKIDGPAISAEFNKRQQEYQNYHVAKSIAGLCLLVAGSSEEELKLIQKDQALNKYTFTVDQKTFIEQMVSEASLVNLLSVALVPAIKIGELSVDQSNVSKNSFTEINTLFTHKLEKSLFDPSKKVQSKMITDLKEPEQKWLLSTMGQPLSFMHRTKAQPINMNATSAIVQKKRQLDYEKLKKIFGKFEEKD